MRNHPLSLPTVWRSLLCGWLLVTLVACLSTPTPTPTPTPLPSKDEGIAVITYITGNVTLLDTGGPVKAFQVLKGGSRLQVAVDAKVTVICFQERWFAVDQPSEVDVTQQCATAAPLPANTAQLVKPDGGRIVLIEGSLALEEQAREREGDYGNIPIILSPRNTSLLELQPTITWVEVSGALEYQLSLSGLSSFDDVILAAETVTCVEESRSAPSRTCLTPWPAVWTLESGQRYFLTVSARTGIASPLHKSEASALRTLAVEEAEGLEAEVTDIQTLELDAETQNILLANLYAENGIYIQATAAYERLVAMQPIPMVYVTLGDLYRTIDLQRYAFNAYQQALDLLIQGEDELAVRAAAEFGMGQVEYSRGNFAWAEPHFGKAIDLYNQIGVQDERRAAERALQATQERRS
jgi:tetratricopeptide (TPR) repeat protein